MTKKTLLPTNDAYIQFTEEELQSIGAGPGTKFQAKLHDDGSIELKKFVSVEIDLSDWSRDVLLMLVTKSIEEDVPVNDIINKLLKDYLDECSNLDEDVIYSKAGIDPNFTNNDTSITNS